MAYLHSSELAECMRQHS